jgi:hypothetical protein
MRSNSFPQHQPVLDGHGKTFFLPARVKLIIVPKNAPLDEDKSYYYLDAFWLQKDMQQDRKRAFSPLGQKRGINPAYLDSGHTC